MIRPKFIICADSVVVDAQTNNISIFNVIEEVTPASFPAIIPRFTILIVLERERDDPIEFDTRLRINLATQTILDQGIHFSFQDKLRTRNIITFGGMPITQPGMLNVTIFKDEAQILDYQILVKEPPAPTRL